MQATFPFFSTSLSFYLFEHTLSRSHSFSYGNYVSINLFTFSFCGGFSFVFTLLFLASLVLRRLFSVSCFRAFGLMCCVL